jgi:hypothetical protein
MNDKTGETFREVFKEHLDVFGEDFHVAGETKRGVFSDDKGIMMVRFPPEEFALKPGETITRWATEEKYSVVSAKAHAIAGMVVSFDVIVAPR